MAHKKKNKAKNNKNNNKKKNRNKGRKGSENSRQNSNNSENNEFSISSNGLKEKTINSNKSTIDVFGDCDQRINIKLNKNNDNIEDKNGFEIKQNSMQDICDYNKESVNNSSNYSPIVCPKGLTNLGNTCYLNSVLQILSETNILYELLNERSNNGFIWRAKALTNINEWTFEKQYEQCLDVFLPNCLTLTNCLTQFMREMHSNNSRTVNPSKLLKEIRKEWSQFSGCSQQDSHELLRCLLDSLKCKEIIRQRKAIINELKCGSDNNVDDDTKSRIKSFAIYSYSTTIDAVFGGQLLSSVCCDACHYTNQIFEPFFDLSLPLNHVKNSDFIESKPKKREQKVIQEKSLLEENSKNLTPKERKLKRQQKKAFKRETKQKSRENESK